MNQTELHRVFRPAIEKRRRVYVCYNGLWRIIEPYLVHESQTGKIIAHGRQTDGEWDKTPPPDWCDLNTERITKAELVDEFFESPHPGYNPANPRFQRVLYGIDVPPERWKKPPSRSRATHSKTEAAKRRENKRRANAPEKKRWPARKPKAIRRNNESLKRQRRSSP
jgi:hypothetical protein